MEKSLAQEGEAPAGGQVIVELDAAELKARKDLLAATTGDGVFSTLIPATYFIELMRAIMLRGASYQDFWMHFAVLAGMGLVRLSFCAWRFKRRIA